MLDDLNPGSAGSPRANRDGRKDAQPRVRKAKEQEIRSVVEREVPLGQQQERVLSPAVHSWLDGELPEAAVRKGATARDVEFWHSVSAEMDRARRLRTPEHVEAQIMAALPHHAPQLITPWWQREFVVTPFAAVSGALVLVALSIALTVAFLVP